MYRIICIIDQARGQDSWILAIGHCLFMDRDDDKVKKNAKKNNGNIQHPNQRSLAHKGIVYMAKKRTFSCKSNERNPEQAHLGSQSEHRICFILLACRFSHIIIG